MNKIEIGSKINKEKLKLLFSVEFESLQYLSVERNWKKGEFEEHGFNFLENSKNLSKIKHLTLKGNYFSPKILEK